MLVRGSMSEPFHECVEFLYMSFSIDRIFPLEGQEIAHGRFHLEGCEDNLGHL